MRTRNFCWLIGAIAVAAVTVALAALVVILIPTDPNAAAVAAQQQVLELKLESIVEPQRRTR